MNFSKKSALFLLTLAIAALFISACASQQSAETKPVNSSTAAQQTTTTQPNPPAPPQPGAEPNAALAPKSKETEVEISMPVNATLAAVGSTVTVPIAINSKSDKEIFSYSLAVMFSTLR